MEKNKSKILVIVLLSVVVLLALVLIYILVVQPSITGFTVSQQIEGYNYAYGEILDVVMQCGTFPIRYGEEEGAVINLIALECLQAPETQ